MRWVKNISFWWSVLDLRHYISGFRIYSTIIPIVMLIKIERYNLMTIWSYIPLYTPSYIYKMLNTNVSQCSLRRKERKIGKWPLISGLIKPSFISLHCSLRLWGQREKDKGYELPGLFPSLEHSKLGKVLKFCVRKWGN